MVPALSQKAKAIYLRGQALGRDPHRFSKVGDCQNITTYFLSHFENPDLYRLGEFASLQPAIDWFMGSFARESLAVKGGMNVAAVLSPLRANAEFCSQGESPLACEFRLYNPSFAIISMEEAWSGEPEKYGKYMRQVIEYTIEQGILPVIATKADNLEGGDRINAIIAQLAWEYDIPLWNFWAAVQPLSGHGLSRGWFPPDPWQQLFLRCFPERANGLYPAQPDRSAGDRRGLEGTNGPLTKFPGIGMMKGRMPLHHPNSGKAILVR